MVGQRILPNIYCYLEVSKANTRDTNYTNVGSYFGSVNLIKLSSNIHLANKKY